MNVLLRVRSLVKPYVSHPALVFIIVTSSQWIDNINLTVGVSTLEQIQTKYNTSYSVASWSLSAYSLCFGTFMLLFGRAGDIVGHHYLYVVGMFSLGVCIMVAASVTNVYVVIVFRALQGVAAASTIPSSYAIVGHSFEGKTLDRAMGILTIMISASAGLGFLIGGAFGETKLGYRGAFYLFGGLALLSSILSAFCVDPVPTSGESLANLDHVGVFLMLSGSLMLVTGLTMGGGEGWKSPSAIAPTVMGIVLVIAFFAWELVLKAQVPYFDRHELLIPHETWNIPNFSVSCLSVALGYAAFTTYMLIALEIFQYVTLNSPIIAGVKTSSGIFTLSLCAVPVTLYYGRIHPKYMITAGQFIQLGGGILLTRMNYTTHSFWHHGLPGLMLTGMGQSFIFLNSFNTLVVSAPLSIQGVVSGCAMTSVELMISAASGGVSSIVGDIQSRTSIEKMTKYNHAMYLPLAMSSANLILSFFFRKVGPDDKSETTV